MASKSRKAEQRKQTQELWDREVEGKIKVPTPTMLVDFTPTKAQRRLEKKNRNGVWGPGIGTPALPLTMRGSQMLSWKFLSGKWR